MKTLAPGLADHLSGDVTTLCRCWKLIRRDGTVMGFTDHDRDIVFGDVTFEASSGLAAGGMEQSLGLNADSQEVTGAFASERITPQDLRGDRYDGASIEVWIVNWTSPDERVLDRVLTMGEIAEEDGRFRAELRALASDMDETCGRRFSRHCDADLGDARCGVGLEEPQFKATGVVGAVHSGLAFEALGLAAFEANWFRGGRLQFDTGACAGATVEIAEHQAGDGGVTLHLWKLLSASLAPGDAFTVHAGCDKTFSTCRAKFGNGVNFRGFPHMPGNDFALGYASTFKVMDGGPIVP